MLRNALISMLTTSHGAHTSFIFRGPYGFTQTTAGHMLMKTSSAFLIMASHESHNFWQLAPFSYGCFSSSPTQSPPVRWSIKVSKEMLIDLLPYHPSLKWLTASFILHTLQSASSIQHDFFLQPRKVQLTGGCGTIWRCP